jgi:anti-anti-sigma factor
LIERPRVPLGKSLEELVDAVNGATTAEDACLLAMDRLVPRRGRDDVAVIAVRPEPVADVLDIELAADASLLSGLRRMLSRWQRNQQLDRTVASEITIAVSEACANAIEHACGPSGGSVHVRASRGHIHRRGDRDHHVPRPQPLVNIADLSIETRGRVVVARLRGDVDMSNAGQLRDELNAATRNDALGLVLDLSEVEYLDSAGIHLIHRLREGLRTRGQQLRLVIPADSVINDTLRLVGRGWDEEVVGSAEAGERQLLPGPGGSRSP